MLSLRSSPTTLRYLLCSTGLAALSIAGGGVAPAYALVTPNSTPPGNVVDTPNNRPYWVGVAIRNEAGNSGGTCTGLLINPRTVLFAAHCADSLAPGSYDSPTAPGNRAAVGYTTDPLFGRANLRNWLFSLDFGTQPGADGRTMNDSVFVWWDPRSRNGVLNNPATQGTFLPADIAIAGFATPSEILGRDARDGLGLLFSPVSSLVPVTIGGYGQSGNGQTGVRTSGSAPESYFRRLGSNMLGFLGDERTIALGVYPTATADLLEPPGLTYQDLYWVDFDDPSRSTRPFFNGPGGDPLCVSPNLNCRLDHDVFPGDAVAGEAITAAGDSGSPLVTNAFSLNGVAREVSLGVLSQGSRFFYESLGNPNDNFVRFTEFSNYGTTGGWNPLFLFWDQIVVNNPYKYVTAAGGTREWTDPTTWTQEIDPLYYTLSGTTLVNGLPTTPALGVSSAAPNVGTVRPSPSPAATCAFLGTCPPTGGTSDPSGDAGAGATSAMPGRLDRDDMSSRETIAGSRPAPGAPGLEGTITRIAASTESTDVILEGVSHTSIAANDALPAAPAEAMTTALWSSGTLIPVNTGALTGPGTTNFVPNNTLGTAGLQNSTRWFEVNLRSAGTLNLTGASITIDRLNVRSSGALLNIRSGASLRTEMSSFLDAGGINVDGVLTARALNVLGGTLTGNGTVTTTAGIGVVGGTVTAGAVGAVGTMTINGSIGFGQAGVLGVDIASATSADRLNINGSLVLTGGGLAVNFLGGYKPGFGTTWTAATATGGVTGSFSAISSAQLGLLFPTHRVSGNTLQIAMDAVPFSGFIDYGSSAQSSLGTALDTLRRSDFAGMSGLFAQVDQLTPAQARAVLEQMAPSDNFAAGHLIDASALSMRDTFAQRMLAARSTGGMAPVAGIAPGAGSPFALAGIGGAAGLSPDAMMNAGPQTVASLGDGLKVFADVRMIDGESRPSASFAAADLEASAYTIGVDFSPVKDLVIGLAGQVLEGETRLAGQQGAADTEGSQLGAYASYATPFGVQLDAYASFGSTDIDLARAVGAWSIRGATSADTMNLGVSASTVIDLGSFGVIPRFALDRAHVEIDGYTETNGPAALVVPSRSTNFGTASLGGTVYTTLDAGGMKIYPRLSVSAVQGLNDRTDVISGAAFASSPGTLFRPISGVAQDDQWLDVGAGVDVRLSDSIAISADYEVDVDRKEVETRTLRLTGKVRF
jgi:uncharacterized protein YhjY with autotransporter beta-barrel domain